MSITPGHPRVPYTTSICTPGIGTGKAGYLHGVWVSRLPVTALVAAHTPIISRLLDIPSPLSVSSIWVRVSVSVRRCCRFSGLYAFHSSDSVAVGIPRRRVVVLVSYKTTTSSTLALLQRVGHWAHHIRSKSASEMVLEDGVRRGVGPRLLVLMVRLLNERYFGSHPRWECYARCSRSLSLCFVVSAHATAFAFLRQAKSSAFRNPYSTN